MTAAVALKLLAIVAAVAAGWVAGRRRWLGEGDPTRVLSAAAFTIFVPALLLRTAARVDLATLPWRPLAAFFVPAVLVLLAVHAARRRAGGAVPAVLGLTAAFGNSVQIGLPVAAALFGEAGLAIHVTLVSLHALVLLSVATTLAELDLARASGAASLGATLAQTARQTVVHPVVLPVLAGLALNALGLRLPAAVDETLALLGTAVVPLCLVLIGLSLAQHGLRGRLRGAVGVSAVKLLAMPALALALGRWGLALDGLALAVVVMAAAAPVGANPLIFAQRYRTREAETTGAIVVSTLAFAATAPLWLAVLALLPPR
jgi:predicted permease